MTELEKAAVEAFKQLGSTSFLEIFKAGAEWQRKQDQSVIETAEDHAYLAGQEATRNQFRKIENYQEEGWYSSGDDEYVYGISFDEPIKLPVEFYVKKK